MGRTAFEEGWVEAAGGRLRYRSAGRGPALVHLLDARAADLTPAHDLLAVRFRVIAIDGSTSAASEVAAALGGAIDRLEPGAFDLMATGAATPAALALALRSPERVRALVLESPAAIGAELDRQVHVLNTPTLVLLGTRDDAGHAAGRACAARLPNAHLVFVYDASSAMGADRPEAFAEVVGDFLERREAFVISRTASVLHP